MAIFTAVCTIPSLTVGVPHRPGAPARLGDLDPFDRLRPVAAFPQREVKFRQIPRRLDREPLDALAIHPGRPLVPRNLAPRGFQGRRPDHLIHQAEPLASFDAVDQRRDHALRPDRGFRPPPVAMAGFCPLLSRFRHCRDCVLLHCGPRASTFLPPFPLAGFASRPSPRQPPHRGNLKALTPGALTLVRQVSLLTPPCRPGIPTSTTRAAHRSLSQSPQRRRLLPGFALNEQARRSFTPNQVRHPTDCRFTSDCFPPRLTATQFPSVTEPATGSGTDFHRADKTSSQSHSFPRKRESIPPPCRRQPWIPAFTGMTEESLGMTP